MEKRKKKDSGSYGGYKLFLSEDELEVVRVDCGIASIPPFRIDVPLSSESIRFSAEITRAEPDNKVELEEILRPPHLPPGQYLGSVICKSTHLENYISVVMLSLKHTSLPSMAATFLATHPMAVLQPSGYSVFYDRDTSIQLGLP